MLVRLSVPSTTADAPVLAKKGIVPEPTYGGQLQDMANPGVAPPEGRVRISYSVETVTFADGSVVELQRPSVQITDLATARCSLTYCCRHGLRRQ